jgi:hypothetical protein
MTTLPGRVTDLGTLLFFPNFAHCPNWITLSSHEKLYPGLHECLGLITKPELSRGPYLLPVLRHRFIHHPAIFRQSSLFDAL